MKVEIRPWSGTDEADVVFDKKITPNRIDAGFVPRPKRGLHVCKKGRICQVAFDATLDAAGHQQVFISLTEAEVLQLAKLCRRKRTDQAFLRAIDVAGATARKSNRAVPPPPPTKA